MMDAGTFKMLVGSIFCLVGSGFSFQQFFSGKKYHYAIGGVIWLLASILFLGQFISLIGA